MNTKTHLNRPSVLVALLLSAASIFGTARSLSQEQSRLSHEDQALLGRIRADSLRGHLSFIASDLLEGRGTPSLGLTIASEYIAAQFRRAGLQPIGDDGYFQTANMIQTVPQPIGFSLVIRRDVGTIEVQYDQVTMLSDQGLDISRAKVFKINSQDESSIASLTPEQIAGQVVIMERPRAGWGDILDKLSALKPLLVIRVDRQIIRGLGVATGQLIDPENRKPIPSSGEAPVMSINNQNVANWFDEMNAGFTGATMSLHAPAAADKPVRLRNVVGLLQGSDATLKDRYVFLTAHYDHLGVDRLGRIYNGANDNGSGTVTVMELASAFASADKHPKRSVVFMTFFGEEEENVGSEYYVHHPIVPLEKTVANVNLEQVGRTDGVEGPEVASATLTGFDFTDMTKTFVAAAKLTGIRVYKDERFSDPYFTESDNGAFAEQGVVAQTLGVLFKYPDYHRPGDKADKIDYENMARVDRLIALGVLMIANASSAPKWNDLNPKTAPYLQAWKSRHQQ